MIHQVAPQACRWIDQPAALVDLTGVQQDPHGFDRGCTQHYKGGADPLLSARGSIHQHHPLGPVASDQQVAHHRVAAHLGAAGGQGPGQGASLAGGAGPASLPMQPEAAGVDQGQPELGCDAALQVPFARGEGQGGQEVAIGQLAQAIAATVHPQQLLEPPVVGGKLPAADWPAGPLASAGGGLEFVVGEPQGDATPGETFAAHLPPPGPQKGGIVGGGVRVAPLIDEQVWIVFPIPRVVALEPLLAAGDMGQAPGAIERLAAEGLAPAQLRPRLQHQHLEPGFGQHHGRYAAGGTGAHHDGVRLQRGVGLGSARGRSRRR